MSFSYNLVLVALSVAVAAQASFMALSLAQRIPAAFALNCRLLTAGSALSLAVGVWSMHFIGMLAVRTPFRLDYALLPTLISLLICVLAAGIAVVLASLRPRRMMLLAAAVLGLGIVAMHFIGMMAMRECASVSYDPAFVLASVVIACTASGSALWLAFSAQRKLPLLLCAIILGLAISGMHYTAMGGTRLQPNPVAFAANGAAISSDLLAAIVSVVAFSISGVFMLTLIPASDDIAAEAQHFAPERNELPGPRCAVVTYNRASNLVGPEILLPIERNGGKLHIAADEIVSVHANAHYTYIFNGADDLFCPLSISEIADQLPKQTFFRTHRSYIVNLTHVTGVKKAGDAAVAELDTPMRRNVPISRSRVALARLQMSPFLTIRGADRR